MTNIFHNLFSDLIKSDFKSKLNLSPDDESTLLATRRELEQVITAGFIAAQQNEKAKKTNVEIPTPKFAVQGSYVYKTIISPAYPPKQQVDIDLGVYLPFTALENGKRPLTTVKVFFNAIESILSVYIKEKGKNWVIQTGKKTCVRVLVNNRIHVDLPLYGVPDAMMKKIVEARRQFALDSVRKSVSNSVTASYEDDSWVDDIDPTVIHMAHKDDGWVPSDPIVIRDWVKIECNNKPYAREICRYLKAWRDEKWKDGGGPTSIFLLAHTIHSYKGPSSNHCVLLAHAIETLPDALNKPLLIPCPTPEDRHAQEDLRAKIDSKQKSELESAFINLRSSYRASRVESDFGKANNILIQLFGSRFPYDPSRIKPSEPLPVQNPRDVVRNTPVTPQPLRSTPRSTSG